MGRTATHLLFLIMDEIQKQGEVLGAVRRHHKHGFQGTVQGKKFWDL